MLVLVADTGSTTTTYLDATANQPGVRYKYRVRALRGSVKSARSNYARVDLPEDDDRSIRSDGRAVDGLGEVTAAGNGTCPGGGFDPVATAVTIDSVPVVVRSNSR